MIAYYVHWIYPPTADDELFYGGIDDEKLFHHSENAEKYAKEQMSEWNNDVNFEYNDLPCDYSIRNRNIEFEDD